MLLHELKRLGLDERTLVIFTEDLGETHNVAADHPVIVADLQARAEAMRQDIGDAATGVPGRNCRPAGRVANPKPLTQFDPAHPYYMAMYDLPDRG